MKLYVMRHGIAEDMAASGRDGDRALTTQGRERVRLVAGALEKEDEAPLMILSSPLVRALQTAEIVAAATDLAGRVRASDEARAHGATGAVEVRRELAPGGDQFALVTALLTEGRKRVMVVGHEPDLGELVVRLTGDMPPAGMQKAMVVGVKVRESKDHTLRFVLDPKSLSFARP